MEDRFRTRRLPRLPDEWAEEVRRDAECPHCTAKISVAPTGSVRLRHQPGCPALSAYRASQLEHAI